jgi:hypothetical protein
LEDDPVIAGEHASDLALVPVRQEFNAHSGIIIVTLFGSGCAGLGNGSTIEQACSNAWAIAGGTRAPVSYHLFREKVLFSRAKTSPAP